MQNFRSDNCGRVHAEIAAALADDMLRGIDDGRGLDYDESFDDVVERRFAGLFDAELICRSVATGTAANTVAVASLLDRPNGSVLCHEQAHMNVWEERAVLHLSRVNEFRLLRGDGGQISVSELSGQLDSLGPLAEGGVLSLTQPTECGTLYPVSAIAQIAETAHRRDVSVHVDGARLANALAALSLEPADFLRRTGIDALSFGGTKLGALSAEAVLLFRPSDRTRQRVDVLQKAAGQKLAKRRFINVQILRLLDDDRWIDIAHGQNRLGAMFRDRLRAIDDAFFVHPVETNQAFIRAGEALKGALSRRSIRFTEWAPGVIRFVFGAHHTIANVETLIGAIRDAWMQREGEKT